MADLEKQVRRVCRRLNFQRFVEILVWCWAAALALALCWVVAEKVWQPLVEPWWISVLASLGAGTVVAAAIWFFTRQSAVEAAVALDHAFGLKERVSSTLTLPEPLRDSPAGIALISDALKRVETIDVGEKFSLRLPRTAWLPVVPALLVFLVATFVGQLGTPGSLQAKTEEEKKREQVETSSKELVKRFEEQKQQAKEQGFAETEKLLAELAQKTQKEIESDKDIDQKKALSKLNTIQDAIKERREKLGSTEQLQQQLDKMKGLSEKGPADKFHEALKKGDYKKAAEELTKMAEQLRTGKMSEEQKKQLAKQMEQMKEQLKKMANIEERKKELEKQLKEKGAPEEVIKQELAKLDAQAQDMQKMQELAEKLGKMQQALEKGDEQQALQAMEMSKADLQQMLKELQEMEMLEKALDDLADMKNAMVCKNCGGGG
jgi:hypothetical protein